MYDYEFLQLTIDVVIIEGLSVWEDLESDTEPNIEKVNKKLMKAEIVPSKRAKS